MERGQEQVMAGNDRVLWMAQNTVELLRPMRGVVSRIPFPAPNVGCGLGRRQSLLKSLVGRTGLLLRGQIRAGEQRGSHPLPEHGRGGNHNRDDFVKRVRIQTDESLFVTGA